MLKTKYKYFQVKPVAEPGVNGAVLRVNKKKLEIFVGDTELHELGVSLKNDSQLSFREKNKYFCNEISEKTARALKSDFEQFYRMQQLVGYK